MIVSAGGKSVAPPVIEFERVGERDRRRRRVDLDERRERRREHAVLEEVPLPGERVVEDPPRAAERRPAVALRIPHRAEPRREVVLVGRVSAARHARVAGIDQARAAPPGTGSTARRDGTRSARRSRRRTAATARSARPAVTVRCGRRAPFVLRVARSRASRCRPAPGWSSSGGTATAGRAGSRPPRCRYAGRRVHAVEGQVAVRTVDERDDHVLLAHVARRT